MKLMKNLLLKYLFYGTLFFLLGLLLIILINIYVVKEAQPFTVVDVAELHDSQTAIVLGASVYGSGKLTPVLQARVDRAIDVYEANIVDAILVSGDNGSVDYNEVTPVREYLLTAGIPSEDIFLDYAGFDTYDSMYRAKEVFDVESAVIVTQSFHLPRAIFIANVLGIKVQGIAPANDSASTYNHLREIPARIKAFLDVIFKSSPTYLGKNIPITGDGRETVNE